MTPEPPTAATRAAEHMDWQQVVMNGGPPCFHIERDGHFCGRAMRWAGHEDSHCHKFVSLADLLRSIDAHGPGAEARRHLERLLDCISETRGKDAYEAVAEARAFLDGGSNQTTT